MARYLVPTFTGSAPGSPPSDGSDDPRAVRVEATDPAGYAVEVLQVTIQVVDATGAIWATLGPVTPGTADLDLYAQGPDKRWQLVASWTGVSVSGGRARVQATLARAAPMVVVFKAFTLVGAQTNPARSMAWIETLALGPVTFAGGTVAAPNAPGVVAPDGSTAHFLRGDGSWSDVKPVLSVETTVAPAAFARAPHQVRVCRTGGAAAVTFTLPVAPEAGDVFEAVNQDSGTPHTLTLARNGQLIDGAGSDRVMASNLTWTRLVYVDATTGWSTGGKQ